MKMGLCKFFNFIIGLSNIIEEFVTLYSIIMPFDAFEISCTVFEKFMENGAFALLEQMLHFP